jgi:hypothetical protein
MATVCFPDSFCLTVCNSFASPCKTIYNLKKIKKLWPESARELYRLSYGRLLVKLVPTFADRGCRVVSITDPYCCVLSLLDGSRYFVFQAAPQLYSRG